MIFFFQTAYLLLCLNLCSLQKCLDFTSNTRSNLFISYSDFLCEANETKSLVPRGQTPPLLSGRIQGRGRQKGPRAWAQSLGTSVPLWGCGPGETPHPQGAGKVDRARSSSDPLWWLLPDVSEYLSKGVPTALRSHLASPCPNHDPWEQGRKTSGSSSCSAGRPAG